VPDAVFGLAEGPGVGGDVFAELIELLRCGLTTRE